mgnify:CR=1 FL=1
MPGIADSFCSVALQSDQFGASKVLRDVIFSDIKNGTDGSVTFSVSANMDASFINYGKNLGNAAAVPAAPAPTAPAATSTPR